MIGALYFIREGSDGCIKIGWSGRDVAARLCDLQVGNAAALTVLATIPNVTVAVEAEWHARFDSAWRRGEWFWPTPELLAAIEEVKPKPAPAAKPAFAREPDEKPILVGLTDRTLILGVWMSNWRVGVEQLAERAGLDPELLRKEIQGEIHFSETSAHRIEIATEGRVEAAWILGTHPGLPCNYRAEAA